uniref:transmembrane protein 132D-like n=1 Tax=Myxine glutinosa TaxID=7769 RepID=UPI00358FF670
MRLGRGPCVPGRTVRAPLFLLLLAHGVFQASPSWQERQVWPRSSLDYDLLHNNMTFSVKSPEQEDSSGPNPQTHLQSFVMFGPQAPRGVNVTLGPFSAWQPLPPHLHLRGLPQTLLQSGSHLNWILQSFLAQDYVSVTRPKVQVLFRVVGRDWARPPAAEKLPCVVLRAFHGAQNIRATCQLKGSLGMCLAQVALPGIWFGDVDAMTGLAKPTVGLYYTLKGGSCDVETLTANDVQSAQHDLQWVGSIHLQAERAPELQEVLLDGNVAIYLPRYPVKHGKVFLVPVVLLRNSTAERFTLRYRKNCCCARAFYSASSDQAASL